MAAPKLFSSQHDERAFSVDLVAPAGILAPRPPAPSYTAPPKTPPVASPNVETSAPPPPPDVAAAVVPGPAAPTPQETRPAGLALRNSIIGCAFTGMVELNDAERRRCHDLFAAGGKNGPDLSGFAVDPVKKAAFDAAAEKEKFLQKPFLTQRPKNGCKPFIAHDQYATLGASRDAYSVSFGCGKTF